jgi:hypothetical protein
MRVIVVGDREWKCDDLAATVLVRLVAKFGPDVVIVHGNEPGVDTAFATAATALGIAVECRTITRGQTGVPTIGKRNWELISAGADMCLAIHQRPGSCPRTLDCVRQALQWGIPTYVIEDDTAVPMPLRRGDPRLSPPR